MQPIVFGMTDAQLEFIKQCIADDNVHAFYTCWAWLKLRAEVLAEDKNECQLCKKRGRYTRAKIVHHNKHVREYPELALSKVYIDEEGNEQRQLISVCNDCHEREHPERFQKNENKKQPLTIERW